MLSHSLVGQPSLHQQPCARGPNGRANMFVVWNREEVCVCGGGGGGSREMMRWGVGGWVGVRAV